MVQILLLLQLILLWHNVIAEYTGIVETDKGKVRGNILETLQLKQQYSAFKSIPYAEPPIGYGRRFRRPVPAKPWDGVLDATEDPNKCAQWTFTMTNYYHGSEDCLYLNVYTPELNFTNPGSRAVMAYIHGGAFEFGEIHSSKLGPDFLIEKDVVVVAMNYRLGIFGFLALKSSHFDANNGLRDQAEALRWIQRNIKNFGGDPDKVTIFGESAGSASVEFHKLSPQSKDLFRASIAMSGSALNKWAFSSRREATWMGRSFVSYLFRYWYSDEDLYRRMVNMRTTSLLDAHWLTCLWYGMPIPFPPTVEDSSNTTDPFLPDDPMELYRSGQFSMKPHMLGFMADEGISFVAPVSIITDILGRSFTKMLSAAVTGIAFIRDIDLTQRFLTSFSEAPVYYYQNSFDYDQALHKVDAMRSQSGAGHGDDLAHVFWVRDQQQPTDPNSDIGRHRERMVTMWTNFAKYLKPTLDDENDPDLGNTKWEKSSPSGGYLDINTDLIFYVNSRPVTETIERMEYDRVRSEGYQI